MSTSYSEFGTFAFLPCVYEKSLLLVILVEEDGLAQGAGDLLKFWKIFKKSQSVRLQCLRTGSPLIAEPWLGCMDASRAKGEFSNFSN